jgi:hypothetical protein
VANATLVPTYRFAKNGAVFSQSFDCSCLIILHQEGTPVHGRALDRGQLTPLVRLSISPTIDSDTQASLQDEDVPDSGIHEIQRGNDKVFGPIDVVFGSDALITNRKTKKGLIHATPYCCSRCPAGFGPTPPWFVGARSKNEYL